MGKINLGVLLLEQATFFPFRPISFVQFRKHLKTLLFVSENTDPANKI